MPIKRTSKARKFQGMGLIDRHLVKIQLSAGLVFFNHFSYLSFNLHLLKATSTYRQTKHARIHTHLKSTYLAMTCRIGHNT